MLIQTSELFNDIPEAQVPETGEYQDTLDVILDYIKNNIWTWIVGIVLLLSLVGIFVYKYLSKQKSKNLTEETKPSKPTETETINPVSEPESPNTANAKPSETINPDNKQQKSTNENPISSSQIDISSLKYNGQQLNEMDLNLCQSQIKWSDVRGDTEIAYCVESENCISFIYKDLYYLIQVKPDISKKFIKPENTSEVKSKNKLSEDQSNLMDKIINEFSEYRLNYIKYFQDTIPDSKAIVNIIKIHKHIICIYIDKENELKYQIFNQKDMKELKHKETNYISFNKDEFLLSVSFDLEDQIISSLCTFMKEQLTQKDNKKYVKDDDMLIVAGLLLTNGEQFITIYHNDNTNNNRNKYKIKNIKLTFKEHNLITDIKTEILRNCSTIEPLIKISGKELREKYSRLKS